MALFDDILNGANLVTGLAIGAGALIGLTVDQPNRSARSQEPHQSGTDRLSGGRAILCRRGGSHRRHGSGSPTRNRRDNTGARPCRGEQFARYLTVVSFGISPAWPPGHRSCSAAVSVRYEGQAEVTTRTTAQIKPQSGSDRRKANVKHVLGARLDAASACKPAERPT
jgi:hypothetical protein